MEVVGAIGIGLSRLRPLLDILPLEALRQFQLVAAMEAMELFSWWKVSLLLILLLEMSLPSFWG
ncbi:hypothetical protein LINPERHAP2_LOCUS35774 [Linum perenne]